VGAGLSAATAHELASLGATVVVIGQAAKVMEIITRAKFEKSGQRVNEPVLKQMSGAIERQSAGSRRRFTVARGCGMTASSIRATPARFCLLALLSLQKPARVSYIQTHLELVRFVILA